MAALAVLCIQGKTFPVHLSKESAALCWKCESLTNQSLQLVYVTSFTHSEPPLNQLCRPAVLFLHSLTLPFWR